MKKNQYLPAIQSNPLFRSLPEEDLALLLDERSSHIKEYQKGAIIHLQNQPCSSMDVILKGSIAIQKLDEQGKVLTVGKFTEGEPFGGNLVFADRNTYPLTISANSNCVILHIDTHLILSLCQRDQDFLTEFVRSISNRSYLISTKLNDVTMKSIRQRITDYLFKESALQASQQIVLSISKKEWAEELGIPRPSLSRELAKMKAAGLIDYGRDWIWLTDNFVSL